MFDLEKNKKKEAVKNIDKEINTGFGHWLFNHESSVYRKIKLANLAKAKELAKSSEFALIFSTKSDLKTFQDSVLSNTSDLIKSVTNEYYSILEESIDDTQKITRNLYDSCNFLLDSLQEEFNKEGIKELKVESVDFSIKENKVALLKDFSIDYTYDGRVEKRHEKSFASSTKRFFGNIFDKDWGTYKVNIETYTINKRDMSEKLKDIIRKKVITPLGEEIEKSLSQLLENNIKSIDQFHNTIENVVAEMNNAISQEKMPGLEEKKLYKKKIIDLQKSSQDIEEDWEKLSDIFAVEKIDTKLKEDVPA